MRRLTLLLLLFVAACDPAPPPATPVIQQTVVISPTSALPTPTSGPTLLPPTPTSPATNTEAPVLPLSPAIADWIRQKALSFRTAEADEDFSDLEPLKKIIGQARIVALGEASHGTHEFFAMKRRILEFLVQEMGFSSLAMEINGPTAASLNTYVQTGQGTPSSYLQWPWNTKEVQDMIAWMHTYNKQATNGPTVSFQGFDIQAPGGEINKVVAYVRNVDAPAADQIEQLYTCFRPYDFSVYNYASATTQVRAECHNNVKKVYDMVNSRGPAYESKSSPQAFAEALHSARIVVQAEDAFTTQDPIQSSTARDHYMAENVAWLLQQGGPNAKIVLWAHNEHVGTAPNGEIQSMGQDLRSQFGTAMVVLGTDFYSGSFNAYTLSGESSIGPLAVHQADTPPAGSYESYLHSAGLPRLILDLRGVPTDSPATEWLPGPRRFRRITAAYDDSHPEYSYTLTSLPQKFDVIIYFQDTTPSRP